MLQWLSSLADTVLSLGYPGVFIAMVVEGFGLPFPGDGALAFYGFSAAKHEMSLPSILCFGLAGYLTGSLMAYALARKLGREWLLFQSERRWLGFRGVHRTSAMLHRFGPWLLIPGRFLPGVRTVSSWVAGIIDMDFAPFLLYTSIGAALWCTCWTLVGYLFHEHLTTILQTLQSSLAYITGAIVVGLVILWWVRRRAE